MSLELVLPTSSCRWRIFHTRCNIVLPLCHSSCCHKTALISGNNWWKLMPKRSTTATFWHFHAFFSGSTASEVLLSTDGKTGCRRMSRNLRNSKVQRRSWCLTLRSSVVLVELPMRKFIAKAWIRRNMENPRRFPARGNWQQKTLLRQKLIEQSAKRSCPRVSQSLPLVLSAVLGARLRSVEVLPSPWRFDAPRTAVFGTFEGWNWNAGKGGNFIQEIGGKHPSQKRYMKWYIDNYKYINHPWSVHFFFCGTNLLELSLVSPPKKNNAGRPGVHIPMPSHVPFPEGHRKLARLVGSMQLSSRNYANVMVIQQNAETTPNLRILNFAAPYQISKSFSDPRFCRFGSIQWKSLIVKKLASSCTTFSRWRSFSFILGNRSINSIDEFNASHWLIHLFF